MHSPCPLMYISIYSSNPQCSPPNDGPRPESQPPSFHRTNLNLKSYVGKPVRLPHRFNFPRIAVVLFLFSDFFPFRACFHGVTLPIRSSTPGGPVLTWLSCLLACDVTFRYDSPAYPSTAMPVLVSSLVQTVA